MKSGKARPWHYAVLLVAACLPYAELANHEFVNWDDPWLVRETLLRMINDGA